MSKTFLAIPCTVAAILDAIGDFCADFFTGAFTGFDEARERFAFSPLPGGGALTFAVALGAGG